MPVFLLTDIEKSTEKWEKYRDKMGQVLARHDAILKETIESNGGTIVKHTGDGVFAIFFKGTPLHCAIVLQNRFEHEDWGEVGDVRIRIGLHTGDAEKRGNDYFGSAVNRTARIMEAAWGGQILFTPEVLESCVLPEKAKLQDLGVHMLQDLGEPQQIFSLMHPDLKLKEFPPLRSLSAHPHNLPSQSTPFVGRSKEIAELIRLLDDPTCRIVNLVGPGGIGKTRLALQVAAERIDRFRHGVYFIPLDALTIGSIQFLVFTIADALKFSFYSREDPKVQLINYLREKEILLVMDNFEHLISEAELITELFENCQKTKFLITSRERLRLKGEWIMEIKGMDFPTNTPTEKLDQYSAVQLFVQSAQRVNSDYILDKKDESAILEICKSVAGIPLGIELAASWVRSLSPTEIAKEINKGLDFLTTTLHGMPKRHQSLRSVFDYSWNLLTKKEKRIFQGIAVFPDGFQRDAVQQILMASLPELTALTDKSLIKRKPNGRYEILQILRQYAQEQLSRDPKIQTQIHSAHCTYYAQFIADQEEKLQSGENKDFYTLVSEEIENFRASWQWGVEHCMIPELTKLLPGLNRFFDMRGWIHEAEQICRITSEMMRIKFPDGFETDEQKAFYAMTIYHWGAVCRRRSQYERGKTLLEECLPYYKALHDEKGMGSVFNELGVIAYRLGEYVNAKYLHAKAIKIREKLGVEKSVAASLNNLAVVVFSLGDYKEAKQLHEKALTIRRRIHNKYGIASSLNNLANVIHRMGDTAAAEKMYEQSLVLRREIGDRLGIASCLNNLGLISEHSGDLQKAKELYIESYEMKKEIGDRRATANTLDNLGRICEKLGDDGLARQYYRDALSSLIEMKAMPTMLAVVATIAEYFLKLEKYDLALVCAALIMHHPGSGRQSKESAQEIITKLEKTISSDEIERVRSNIETQNVEEVVQRIITALDSQSI